MPETLKPTREFRIEMAKRYAPQNAAQEREGLALGKLVTVNADMIKLLQEDMEAWKAKAEKLSELEKLAREVVRTRDDESTAEVFNDALDALADYFRETGQKERTKE